MSKETGGPAFPSDGVQGPYATEGMTLLDYFAGQALMGIWSNTATISTIHEAAGEGNEARFISEMCYQQAAEMIAERNK